MGLFSEKVQYWGTSVQRVVEDKLIPDSAKQSVLRAILKEDAPGISESLAMAMGHSAGPRANQMYRWAEDNYVHGLPSGEFSHYGSGESLVQTLLDTIEGVPVTMTYWVAGQRNLLHAAWMRLVNVYGWSYFGNRLHTSGPGLDVTDSEVYVRDIQIAIPTSMAARFSPQMLAQLGPPARSLGTIDSPADPENLQPVRGYPPVLTDNTLAAPVAKISIRRRSTLTGFITDEMFTISLATEAEPSADWLQVRYELDGGDTIKWFNYQLGTGVYPTVDGLMDAVQEAQGEYFPFIYFRYDKVNQADDKTSRNYTDGKKLCKFMGMDFDGICDAVNQNPGIEDVEQAMMIMAVPATTDNDLEQKYLFEYFQAMYVDRRTSLRPPTILAFEGVFNEAMVGPIPYYAQIIKDNRFKMALVDQGIQKQVVAGTLGPVGSCHSGFEHDPYMLYMADFQNGNDTWISQQIPVYWYAKQVMPGMYVKYRVSNLQLRYYVHGDYASLGNEDEQMLLVPIDRVILNRLSMSEQEQLTIRSMYYVFNSFKEVELEWYQTFFFQFLIQGFAFVTMIMYVGPLVNDFVGAMGVGGAALTNAVVNLIQDIIIKIVIGAAIKELVGAIGGEAAMVLAAAAAIYGGFKAFEAGSIAGAPWAEELLKFSTGLVQGVGEFLKGQMAGLQTEVQSFLESAEQKQDALKTAQSLLEQQTLLSPFVVFGESPNDFYNRTVHSGNIGAMGFTAISSYVDIALTLPRLDASIGD